MFGCRSVPRAFIDPLAAMKVQEGIAAYMDRHGVSDMADLVGAVRREG